MILLCLQDLLSQPTGAFSEKSPQGLTSNLQRCDPLIERTLDGEAIIHSVVVRNGCATGRNGFFTSLNESSDCWNDFFTRFNEPSDRRDDFFTSLDESSNRQNDLAAHWNNFAVGRNDPAARWNHLASHWSDLAADGNNS